MYDKKKCPNVDILLVVILGEIGPSFDIPDLWSFWARGIFSLLIIRAPLVQRMYLSGQRKMDFYQTYCVFARKNKSMCFEQQRICSRLPKIATPEIFAENFIFKACSLPLCSHWEFH